jgi:hypothetical protein
MEEIMGNVENMMIEAFQWCSESRSIEAMKMKMHRIQFVERAGNHEQNRV